MGRLDSRCRSRHFGLFAGATAVVLSVSAILAATSERMLQSQFAAAAAVSPAATTGHRSTTAAAVVPTVSGSESYWLGDARHAGLTPVGLQGPFVIGDRVTIDGQGGKRVLEVVALAEIPAGVVSAAVGEDQSGPLVLVTCRVVSSNDGGVDPGGRVRFIVEPGVAFGAAGARRPHAL